jgi:hypothetical protein
MTEMSDATGSDEPTPTEAPSRQHRPRWLVAVMAGGIAVLLVAAGLAGSRVLGWWGDDEPAARPQPSSSPTQIDPFAGTPAEDFAEGADGIVLPEAEPIGDFTADEVAEALEQVREALIAARLDPTVLVDHDLEPLVGVVAPNHQPALEAAIDSAALGPFPTLVASGATLRPEPPRVKGRITYEFATAGAQESPIVQVVTRFVWVYAFESSLVVARDDLVWEVVLGRPWGESSYGLWLADAEANAWGVDCRVYPEVLRPGTIAKLTDTSVFDPEQPLDAVPGC